MESTEPPGGGLTQRSIESTPADTSAYGGSKLSEPEGREPKGSGKGTVLPPWTNTTAGQRAHLHFIVTSIVGGVICVAGFAVFLSSIDTLNDHDKNVRSAQGGVILLVGLAIVGVAVVRLNNARIRYQEAEEARSRETVDNLIDQLRDDRSFPSLLKVNQAQVYEYHGITKHQAENAYRNSQIAMGAGLIILILATAAAVALQNNASRILLGSIAGLGVAFSAYITATYLKVYQSTLAQLNFYFRQPLVNSYLLSAERLTGDMSAEQRDDMRARIIDAMLQGAIDEIRVGAGGTPNGESVNGRGTQKSATAAKRDHTP